MGFPRLRLRDSCVCAWHINAKILIYSNGFIKCCGVIIIIIDKVEWREREVM